ncbi:MAG: DUF2158 domain-containing protein [Prevotella sp.]|nr:DUF2158 domain-containing protein [Candidatus Prevotella equi]
MAQFNKGDIVNLKSGSPDMTVISIITNSSDDANIEMAYEAYKTKFGESDAFYVCKWFSNGSFKEEVFPEEAIE